MGVSEGGEREQKDEGEKVLLVIEVSLSSEVAAKPSGDVCVWCWGGGYCGSQDL